MSQRARTAAWGAALGVLLLVALDLATFHLGVVERLDAAIYNGFGGLGSRPRIGLLADRLARLCDPVPYVYLCAIPLAIALIRRRADLALLTAVILLGANLTTHWLKPALDQARPAGLTSVTAPPPGSWPSGHATAAMSLALCLTLVVSARYRRFAAVLGAGFALAVAYSFLALGWHYPSDALGGFLVAFTWTCLGVAAHAMVRGRRAGRTGRTASAPAPRPPRSLARELAPLAAGVLATVLVGVALTLARPEVVVPYARGHERFIAGVGAIFTLAVALAAGVIAILRRDRA